VVSDKLSVDSIFLAAVELQPDQRSAYLNEACGQDEELRARVERLLASQSQMASFLESPAPELGATIDRPITEQPGTVIGPYKLLQQIGEGGMGVVFMAEQTHPVQRTVALKIIKPGMDTRQVIARFEAERQALALMDHPNIARVLDVGATDSGRPYFVMDLVKGVPITDYCDQQHLPVRQRLELFMKVCQAVQHAHQKGLIHRDLKPSNVLVAEYDDQAVPKVIDFGVAKATASKLTEKTMFTELGQLIGTVEYMSPEQAKLNQLDVDTRSDIYSLGVLLYELLAGSTPFERKRLRGSELDEALRIIREEEPPRPSTRLTTLAGEAASTIAEQRSSDRHRLRGVLRGELDWIVMKCLEKDRNRRYESPSALAADIRHHLANEPVIAGPPSRLYRAGKFVRRNRGLVVAASLVAVAILGGIAASTWQAVRATRAEREAVANAALARESAEAERRAKEAESAQRKQAETISDFLISAFNAEQPEHDIQALAQILKQSGQELQSAYPDDPAARAVFLATMGRAHAGLRRFDEAEKLYRQCLEVASNPGLIDRVRHELATCLLRGGKSDEATPMLHEFFVDRLKRSAAPDAAELLAILPTLPRAKATVDGTPGMAGLDLDGDNHYVVLPRVFFDARPPWTLEAIIWPEEIDPSNPQTGSPAGWTSLISAADAGSIGLESIKQRWAIELYAAGVAGAEWVDNYASATSRIEVPLRRWQHVAGVWDGKDLRLYFDGQLQDTRRGVTYCTQLSNAPMFLGADPANLAFVEQVAEGFFHGRLRCARISHSAEYTDSFSPPERLDKTPGTIGLYDFTIDTDRYAIDRSGHGNHGIIIGAKFAKGEND
jgi:serine/threonine protein kinase/tetratricopeptide (TPR) repeat protein